MAITRIGVCCVDTDLSVEKLKSVGKHQIFIKFNRVLSEETKGEDEEPQEKFWHRLLQIFTTYSPKTIT